MKTHKTLLRSLTLALASLLLMPSLALAAPNRVALFDVRTLLESDGTRGMLVAEELAPSVQLPAEVRLPVPKGVKVAWAGEILGGDPSQDPSAQYRTEPGADYDTIVFTVKQARRAQVEFALPAPASASGGTRMGITWAAPEGADTAQLAVQIPLNAEISSVTPGASATTVSNSVFYVKQFQGVTKGKRLDLAVVYTGGTLPQPQQQSQPQQSPSQQAPSQAPQGSAPPSTPGGTASPAVVVLALGIILGGTFYLLDRVKQPQTSTTSK